MRFEYELIIVCAIIALGVVHLIDMQLQLHRIRKARRDKSASGPETPDQSGSPTPLPSHRSPGGVRFHRFVMTLLILALIWSGILLFTGA